MTGWGSDGNKSLFREDEASQLASIDAARIDSDFIVAESGSREGGMAENDFFAPVIRRVNEFSSNPQHDFFIGFAGRESRQNTGVNEKVRCRLVVKG